MMTVDRALWLIALVLVIVCGLVFLHTQTGWF